MHPCLRNYVLEELTSTRGVVPTLVKTTKQTKQLSLYNSTVFLMTHQRIAIPNADQRESEVGCAFCLLRRVPPSLKYFESLALSFD
jgi:hypothetical protein